jgi:hypothetical protein
MKARDTRYLTLIYRYSGNLDPTHHQAAWQWSGLTSHEQSPPQMHSYVYSYIRSEISEQD